MTDRKTSRWLRTYRLLTPLGIASASKLVSSLSDKSLFAPTTQCMMSTHSSIRLAPYDHTTYSVLGKLTSTTSNLCTRFFARRLQKKHNACIQQRQLSRPQYIDTFAQKQHIGKNVQFGDVRDALDHLDA